MSGMTQDMIFKSGPTNDGRYFGDLRPLAHRDDPRSSHEAIKRHTASGRAETHADIALDLVRCYPGSTSAELGVCMLYGTGLDLTELRRRLTGLKNDGRIVRGEERKCQVAGTPAVTWRVAT